MGIHAQVDIEDLMVKVSDQLEEWTDKLIELADESAEVEADYKLAYFRSILHSQGKSEENRKAEANVANEPLFRAHLTMEARVDATKQKIRSLQSRLDTLRSINANVRAQVGP